MCIFVDESGSELKVRLGYEDIVFLLNPYVVRIYDIFIGTVTRAICCGS
jgi:hypothetical protein